MMHIEIAARQLAGCTDFVPQPARLHLGSQNAQGVDTLAFALPAAWAGMSVTLHIQQADGVLPTPLLLDSQGRVAVDRRLTAATAGRWMLTATDGDGYTAYTQPGSYDTCEILPTDGDADRIGVIDDTGRFLHPNDILVLLYYYLVKYKGWSGPVVRNISTTHMLDRVAESFGQTCYEVPVGFKYISKKMSETGAIIGGESSGGLTIQGHIHGKDGVYAACLLVEMIAVTGKKLSEIYRSIREIYGSLYMEERSYTFTPEKKEELNTLLMEERKVPSLPFPVSRISYEDGCKVYLENGGWISARFSGTEPLLRIFCEMEDREDAVRLCRIFEDFLGLKSPEHF